MPELPENEVQRRLMEAECLGRTIVAVEPGEDITFITLPGANERKRLVGHRFSRTARHGKNLFIGSADGPWLVVHLGMTGRLVPFDTPEEPPRYTRLLITFEGTRRLAFRDQRKLGKVRVIDDPAPFVVEHALGPDALAIKPRAFAAAIGGSHSPVKAALMDQGKLAGIGNLWSDEILFRTGVQPLRPADQCTGTELAAMHRAMRTILARVIECDVSGGTLPRSWLVRHRRKGGKCPRCRVPLETARTGGRTSYFCPQHQR